MFEEGTNADVMISEGIGIQLEVFIEIRVHLERQSNTEGKRLGILDSTLSNINKKKIMIRSTS